MKIILSRKGFDSASGRVPSPIFPNGTISSLPIPDELSRIRYKDISSHTGPRVGELVEQLGSIRQNHGAHLDPDLASHSLPRAGGWRPIFGQTGSAESHLKNQRVDKGDLFLFFGLFRKVEKINLKWRFTRGSTPIHLIFGWMQIKERVHVSDWPKAKLWANSHPHISIEKYRNSVLYVGADSLSLNGRSVPDTPGAGIFKSYSPALRLTDPDSKTAGQWLLPGWFNPKDQYSGLTYHRNLMRWQKREDDTTLLSSVGRGQEFVLDCRDLPQSIEWLKGMLHCTGD